MRDATHQDYQARIFRVLLHIQRHLDDDLALAELARIACFSPYHFHRVFRGMVGESVGAHIRRIRLERAAQQLRTTKRGVTAVALQAGYESHEAFTRAFKTLTGLTPSAFRTQHCDASLPPAPSGIRYTARGRPAGFHPLTEGGSIMQVRLEDLAPMRVAFVRHVGPYDQCGTAWETLVPRLGAEGRLGPGTMFIGICYDDPEITPPDRVRYDACVTVDDTFEPGGAIGVQTLEGGEYAVTTHQGPYSRFGETYGAFFGQWIPQSGRTLRDAPCLEVYLNDPEGTEPEELLTDIYAPLEPR